MPTALGNNLHKKPETAADTAPIPMEQRIHDAFNAPLLPLLPSSVHRVLDIGCGSGVLGAHIKQQHPDCTVIGITLSPEEARAAGERLDRVIVRDLQTETFRDLGRFDCIVCSHVLGYFTDTARLLHEIRDTLTPDGRLVTAIPNILHWPQRLRFLRGQFRYTDGGLMDRYYVRFFDHTSVQDVLRHAGFDILVFQAEGYVPLGPVRRLLGQTRSKRWDASATRRFPGFFGMQFLIAAQPQPESKPQARLAV